MNYPNYQPFVALLNARDQGLFLIALAVIAVSAWVWTFHKAKLDRLASDIVLLLFSGGCLFCVALALA